MARAGLPERSPVLEPGPVIVREAAPPAVAVGVQSAARRIGRALPRILESRVGTLGLAIVAFWVAVAILAPVLSPHSPTALVGRLAEPPSARHWLGTDEIGRDVASRVVWGSRTILLLAPTAVAAALVVGGLMGLVAGYRGGLVDELIMRTSDIILAFPVLLLYMIIIAAVGPSALNIIFAVTFASSPAIARIMRSVVLEVRSREFVAAARLRGESAWYIMLVEILPNAKAPLIVDACLRVGYVTFTIGTLGFLGLGIPPPTPDWGGMVNAARNWIIIAPWMAAFPALAISSLVVGLNLFADGLREISLKD
ncbi:MAG: ABC transporter permease [Candidatus Rokubacteria bacterium]|nr:ABC transporter permease [Candidatus Rokubacteria bacterium]